MCLQGMRRVKGLNVHQADTELRASIRQAETLSQSSVWDERALRINARIIELDEKNVGARTRLAKYYLDAGNADEAGRLYEETLKLEPTNRIARNTVDRLAREGKSVANPEPIDTAHGGGDHRRFVGLRGRSDKDAPSVTINPAGASAESMQRAIRALKASPELWGAARALFELAAERPGERITFSEGVEHAHVTVGQGQASLRAHWMGQGLPAGLSSPLRMKKIAGNQTVYWLSAEHARLWNAL